MKIRPSYITCSGAYEIGMIYRKRGFELFEAMDDYEAASMEDDGPMSEEDQEAFEAGWEDAG